ncbi:MAG: hypothetical protein WDM81_02460 [Rhizomicrobium sp.]
MNIDVDNHWDNRIGGACYGGCYHPVARGIAIGTAAAVTAAAIGSMVYSLPPACVTQVYPSGDLLQLRRRLVSAALCRHPGHLRRRRAPPA